MVVISDTTAVTNLFQIKLLLIIRDLYGKVIIPNAVYEELSNISTQKKIIDKSDWIIIREAQDQKLISELRVELDKGEAEAIALAIEMKSDYLIIDELDGREMAKKYGIRIIGLLGVLLLAKENRLISAVEPYMKKLKEDIGFRISDRLYDFILEKADEKK